MDYMKPQMAVHSSIFSPPDLHALNVEIKGIVWVLRLAHQSQDNALIYTFATAFSVDNNGLIMTSAFPFRNKPLPCINARRLDDDAFLYEVKVVRIKSRWNVALLRVKNVPCCNFGRFAVDSSLFEGQKVLHMGHPGNFVGSLTVGTVVFPCVDNVHVPLDNQKCENYTCTALNITPQYRIMGNIWNSGVWVGADLEDYVFERQLHPQTPIIQIYGLGFRDGCLGGPVFNIRGEIVGMMSMSHLNFEIAIHGSLLRQVLSEIEEKKEGGDNKQDKSQAGCSKRRKR
ncbi:uncharacterized protein LOC126687161 [Mercurialis annua]|uniref:uncharacterized protein LOC126687161 n=1 Tax=Mercurialis annua TaxID=3986 RepID=UPI002160954A|nr:uncharacterized protein LOC126687161 [Mercurialis annua]